MAIAASHIPIWYQKFVCMPLVILGGLLLCYLAYRRPPDTRPFRISDLFRKLPAKDKTKTHPAIQGVAIICFGIGGLILLTWVQNHPSC